MIYYTYFQILLSDEQPLTYPLKNTDRHTKKIFLKNWKLLLRLQRYIKIQDLDFLFQYRQKNFNTYWTTVVIISVPYLHAGK